MAYTLPSLPYATNALEPYIDTMTMEIHHGRHHKAYVDNLNKALESHPAWPSKPIEQLLREISQVPEAIRQPVINNGGGHANHTMFWEIMAPKAGGQPSGPSGRRHQGRLRRFCDLSGARSSRRPSAGSAAAGPGLSSPDGKLKVVSSANQDSPVHDRPDRRSWASTFGNTPII